MSKKIIFSGVAPSGDIHIGNYLGALKNWAELQFKYNSIFCIVDMHAITMPRNPEELRKKTLEVAKIYLAAGIDPKNSTIFIQSQIPQHAELMWILNTIAKTGEMSRMTQFKDKAELSTGNSKALENVFLGIFNYPILMAADILLYNTSLVPVGEDQLQHIELTRTLAKKFNNTFGKTFTIPESYTTKKGQRIMGLDDPTKKMSKSAQSKYNRIELLDSPEAIKEKCMKAVTDSGSNIEYSEDRPALKNLINIFSSVTKKSTEEIASEYKNKGYKEFKESLADAVIEFLKPFQEKYNQLQDDEVLEILHQGAKKLEPIAQVKIREVNEKVGFII